MFLSEWTGSIIYCCTERRRFLLEKLESILLVLLFPPHEDKLLIFSTREVFSRNHLSEGPKSHTARREGIERTPHHPSNGAPALLSLFVAMAASELLPRCHPAVAVFVLIWVSLSERLTRRREQQQHRRQMMFLGVIN